MPRNSTGPMGCRCVQTSSGQQRRIQIVCSLDSVALSTFLSKFSLLFFQVFLWIFTLAFALIFFYRIRLSICLCLNVERRSPPCVPHNRKSFELIERLNTLNLIPQFAEKVHVRANLDSRSLSLQLLYYFFSFFKNKNYTGTFTGLIRGEHNSLAFIGSRPVRF